MNVGTKKCWFNFYVKTKAANVFSYIKVIQTNLYVSLSTSFGKTRSWWRSWFFGFYLHRLWASICLQCWVLDGPFRFIDMDYNEILCFKTNWKKGKYTVRNLHFLSKNSTLIFWENCRFFGWKTRENVVVLAF